MKILKLQLENFRNYDQRTHEFDLDSPLTIFVGANGLGKTNFLEAIYALSIGRSFRTNHPDHMIQWEKDYFRLAADVQTSDDQFNLEVFYSHQPTRKKNYKKNDVNLKNSEFIGCLLTVLFHPEDLNMLYLSPSYRRKYLDILLSQTDKNYLFALTQYKKILKQRNALLHQIRDHQFKKLPTESLRNDLNAWDQQIVTHGQTIIDARQNLLQYLNQHLQTLYQQISEKEEQIQVRYDCSIQEDYAQELEQGQQKDIITAKSNRGPHRDDLQFFLNDKEITSQASRGEFRTLLLAIKLAEIDFITEKTGHRPILLLDDIFSELDPTRIKNLLATLREHQAIITTTDATNLPDIAQEAAIVKMP